MLGAGTSLKENEAAEADAMVRPAEAARVAAAAAAPSPAAMRAGTRRRRCLILDMMVSRLDDGATAAPHLRPGRLGRAVSLLSKAPQSPSR
jgi:hypothetical protein